MEPVGKLDEPESRARLWQRGQRQEGPVGRTPQPDLGGGRVHSLPDEAPGEDEIVPRAGDADMGLRSQEWRGVAPAVRTGVVDLDARGDIEV